MQTGKICPQTKYFSVIPKHVNDSGIYIEINETESHIRIKNVQTFNSGPKLPIIVRKRTVEMF